MRLENTFPANNFDQEEKDGGSKGVVNCSTLGFK